MEGEGTRPLRQRHAGRGGALSHPGQPLHVSALLEVPTLLLAPSFMAGAVTSATRACAECPFAAVLVLWFQNAGSYGLVTLLHPGGSPPLVSANTWQPAMVASPPTLGVNLCMLCHGGEHVLDLCICPVCVVSKSSSFGQRLLPGV